MSYNKSNDGILYCKTCGFAFGGGDGLFVIPKPVERGKCPICGQDLFSVKGDDTNFAGKVEKSMPIWEDVFRNKYITKKKIVLNDGLAFKRRQYEQNLYQSQRDNLKQKETPYKPSTPTVECPYCHSTNTHKISGLSKVGSVALWGIFAMGKTSKQWHCNDCKSDF